MTEFTIENDVEVQEARKTLSELQGKERGLRAKIEEVRSAGSTDATLTRAEKMLTTKTVPPQERNLLDRLHDELRVTTKAVGLQQRKVRDAEDRAGRILCQEHESEARGYMMAVIEAAKSLNDAVRSAEGFFKRVRAGNAKPGHWSCRVLTQTIGDPNSASSALNQSIKWFESQWGTK